MASAVAPSPQLLGVLPLRRSSAPCGECNPPAASSSSKPFHRAPYGSRVALTGRRQGGGLKAAGDRRLVCSYKLAGSQRQYLISTHENELGRAKVLSVGRSRLHTSRPRATGGSIEPSASSDKSSSDGVEPSQFVNAEWDDVEDAFKEGLWQRLLEGLLAHGIDGMGVADSAKELADKYAADHKYVSLEERVEMLIRVESAKSFAAGFVSGIGGLWTLPVAVPASVYANWVLQARIAGAIAHLYGHDLKTERIRSLCLLCLLGESAWGVLKGLGVRVIEKAASRAIQSIPNIVLIRINQAVGRNLVVKAGGTGAIKLQRAVPIIGGVVAGAFDASGCMVVGRVAARMFAPDNMDSIPLDWDGTLDVEDYTVS